MVTSAQRVTARAATARGSGSCAFISDSATEASRSRARPDATAVPPLPRHGASCLATMPAVHTRRGTAAGTATVALAVALVLFGLDALHSPDPAPANPTPAPTGAPGPAPAYRCTFNVNTDAFTGAAGTASAIGWLGDHNSVITCLGGTFVVQDGPGGLFQQYGFGIYEGQRTTWGDVEGYLPAQVTTFADRGATVAVTEFADRIVLGGSPFVAVYSRVRVDNPTGHTVTLDPGASSALVPLGAAPDAVPAHDAVDHDYVVASDRFGSTTRWPGAQALAAAGGFAVHFAHMPRLLGGPADRHRAHRCARPHPRRRLQERLHHHAAHAERRHTSTPASTATRWSSATT